MTKVRKQPHATKSPVRMGMAGAKRGPDGKDAFATQINGDIIKARFRKRSDVIAEELKRWIVTERRQPGDRLPQECDLTKLFGTSRWTIREALKSLEVQGLITISSGPRGGATIAEVTERNAMDLLANYFYFRPITARHLYDLRKILEPVLAVEAADHLSEEQLLAMARTIEVTKRTPETAEDSREIRTAEIEFHNIIADACPNLVIAFVCRFINELLRDWVVFNRTYVQAGEDFSRENLCFHEELLRAFRSRDHEAISRLMAEHMEQAAYHTVEMKGELEVKFLSG